jgi:hypothetical protein
MSVDVLDATASRAPMRRGDIESVDAAHGPAWAIGAAGESRWLLSASTDFWLICAGGGIASLLVALALVWHGDRELALADLLLSELHLGATYDAIVRRRLWRSMPLEVVGIPLVILAATYAVTLHGGSLLLVTSIVYLGAWHRGRQNLGIARHYQRLAGGPASPRHRWILATATYLPMAAAVAYFTAASPLHEGEEYLTLPLPPAVVWTLGALAVASVALHLGFTAATTRERTVHPAERWLVLANAATFGAAYVVGAWMESFILALVLHHEVQYLAFTYATARSRVAEPMDGARANLRLLASFATWPALGLASWVACRGWDPPGSLEPFLTAGLLAHYWLDGRIWTARARRLAA